MKRLLLISWIVALGLGCTKAPSPVEPAPPVPQPVVELTRGFGDSPLVGEIVLTPSAGTVSGNAWRYSIELDSDGRADAAGEVRSRVVVPYRFETPGPHRIEVVLTRGAERQEIEEFVVVNDPSALEVVGALDLPVGEGFLTGIAVDRRGEHVYVAGTFRDPGPLFSVNAATMTLEGFGSLDQGVTEGLSAAPDEDLLYAVSKEGDFEVISIPGMERVAFFDPLPVQFHVLALPGRRAYAGGWGFTLIDTETGAILEEMPGLLYSEFALSPNGTRIGLLSSGRGGIPDELFMLTASDLETIWRTDLRALNSLDLPADEFVRSDAIAFSSDGDRLYVTRFTSATAGTSGSGRWEFLVLDARDGRLVRKLTLGYGCSIAHCQAIANSTALSADGRWAAMVTGVGTFFIDRELDLPLYRTPDDILTYCCNVAANPVRNEFFFSGFQGERVTKVRVRG